MISASRTTSSQSSPSKAYAREADFVNRDEADLMVVSDAEAGRQIAAFTGLDQETVVTQILPYVKSQSDAPSLRHHLTDLIGPGSAQVTFVNDFVASQFPQKAATPSSAQHHASGPSRPASQPIARTGARGSGRGNVAGRSAQLTSADRPPVDLSQAFGSSGQVYTKKPEEFSMGSQARSKGVSSAVATPSSSARASPVPRVAASIAESSSSGSQARAAPPVPETFQLAPTEEMKRLDAEIAELTTAEGSGRIDALQGKKKEKRQTCFCQGRVHPLFSRHPLCIYCGLLLCSMNRPSPFSPTATCPSCSELLLPAQERSNLLADLVTQREEAERRALARAEQVRAERERLKADKQAAAAAEVFPQLAGGDAIGQARQKERDIAMGRRARDEGYTQSGLHSGNERKSKVITIGKKGKVTIGSGGAKKKKVAVPLQAAQATDHASTGEAEEADQASDSDSDSEIDAEEAASLGLVTNLNDSGVRRRMEQKGIYLEKETMKEPPPDRPFFNPYLSTSGTGDAKPTNFEGVRYIPKEERQYLCDGEAQGDEEEKDAKAAGGAASLASRPAVPGAALPGGKGKQSRGA